MINFQGWALISNFHPANYSSAILLSDCCIAVVQSIIGFNNIPSPSPETQSIQLNLCVDISNLRKNPIRCGMINSSCSVYWASAEGESEKTIGYQAGEMEVESTLNVQCATNEPPIAIIEPNNDCHSPNGIDERAGIFGAENYLKWAIDA